MGKYVRKKSGLLPSSIGKEMKKMARMIILNGKDVEAEFVYLIKASDGDGLIKIGRTINLPQRLKELQSMSPSPLSLLYLFSCRKSEAKILERLLHWMFSLHRSHGEWFRPNDEILTFAEEAKNADWYY